MNWFDRLRQAQKVASFSCTPVMSSIKIRKKAESFTAKLGFEDKIESI